MKAVIQRVSEASVSVDGKIVGACQNGYLILLGVAKGDTEEDARVLAKKTALLRIFSDEQDKINLSVLDVCGEALVISQFTLIADVKKGNRPSFIDAMPPEEANRLYEFFCDELKANGVKKVEKGVFGADMKVNLVNDGPFTILYDTEIWRKNGN